MHSSLNMWWWYHTYLVAVLWRKRGERYSFSLPIILGAQTFLAFFLLLCRKFSSSCLLSSLLTFHLQNKRIFTLCDSTVSLSPRSPPCHMPTYAHYSALRSPQPTTIIPVRFDSSSDLNFIRKAASSISSVDVTPALFVSAAHVLCMHGWLLLLLLR